MNAVASEDPADTRAERTVAAARRTAHESPWPERVARAGLVARGAMHVVIGWLALRIAFGHASQHADARGALAAVASQPGGRILVIVLALGFLAYAGWRLYEAALNPEGCGAKDRLSALGKGLVYLALAGVAASYVVGAHAGASSSSPKEQDVTAGVMGWPAGRVLIAAVGLVIITVGIVNVWQGITRTFERDLKHYEMSPGQRHAVVGLGVAGLVGRGLAFGISGGFVLRAAIRVDRRGVGLDAALHEVAGHTRGDVLLAAVALGFIAFGLFDWALARYRRVFSS
ncbi:MAG TPA: DUF1206 domain-containing protein [Acidimicrobiales bacterium]|nr:DUF1206 domain-containing protein [Acidimicrobiales bacterium]